MYLYPEINYKIFENNFINLWEYYKNFNNNIDLLYLDSLDGHDPVAASEHQLKEAKISIKKLHEKSLILLDDKGSKTNLSINFFLNSDFKIIFETDYQVLLSK